MTKQEALSEIMYNLKFSSTVDFEVDEESYSINNMKDENGWFQGFELSGSNIESTIYPNKTDLKKAISKLGKSILVL